MINITHRNYSLYPHTYFFNKGMEIAFIKQEKIDDYYHKKFSNVMKDHVIHVKPYHDSLNNQSSLSFFLFKGSKKNIFLFNKFIEEHDLQNWKQEDSESKTYDEIVNVVVLAYENNLIEGLNWNTLYFFDYWILEDMCTLRVEHNSI